MKWFLHFVAAISLLLCLGSVALWCSSFVDSSWWEIGEYTIHSDRGSLTVMDTALATWSPTFLGAMPPGNAYGGHWWCVTAVTLVLPLVWLLVFIRGRRPVSGCCTNCQYDLRGSRGSICPECGTDFGDQAN
jgi:hypothetical protein